MDRLVAARKLVGELVKSEQAEVRRVEIVGRDLATWMDQLGRPPTGSELEEWLDAHAQVTELYASASLLEELSYRHLTPPPEALEHAPEARNPDLEREIREAPTSPEPYLVYADWLQEQRDPLGELIALGVAATASGSEDDATRFARYRQAIEPRLLGPLKSKLHQRVALQWRNGLVGGITELDQLGWHLWAELLDLRVCDALQAITLVRPVAPELDETIDEHASSAFSTLSLVCSGRLPDRILRRPLQRLALSGSHVVIDARTVAPTLQALELRVDKVEMPVEILAPLALPIRELAVSVTTSVANFLANRVQLPRVERIVFTGSASKAVSLLARLELPALRELTITDGALDARALGKLATIPSASQLVTISLENTEIDDAAMKSFAKKAGAFTSLHELDVSYNELGKDGLAAARTLAKTVASRRQHKPGDSAERRVRKFAGTRLVVAEGIADMAKWKHAARDGEIRWATYRGEDEYELFVSRDLQDFGCSCPSSIQPCKHVVALALVAERNVLPERAAGGIEDRVRRMRLAAERIEDEDE